MQRESAPAATSETAASEIAAPETAMTENTVLPARVRFGSSEVPASRATQDRITFPSSHPT